MGVLIVDMEFYVQIDYFYSHQLDFYHCLPRKEISIYLLID